MLHDEVIDESLPLTIFHPIHTWKKKNITNYYVKDLMVKIFDNGKPMYTSPSVMEIREFSNLETEKLWPEVLRFENPHEYPVDLSDNLWSLKQTLLHSATNFYS